MAINNPLDVAAALGDIKSRFESELTSLILEVAKAIQTEKKSADDVIVKLQGDAQALIQPLTGALSISGQAIKDVNMLLSVAENMHSALMHAVSQSPYSSLANIAGEVSAIGQDAGVIEKDVATAVHDVQAAFQPGASPHPAGQPPAAPNVGVPADPAAGRATIVADPLKPSSPPLGS